MNLKILNRKCMVGVMSLAFVFQSMPVLAHTPSSPYAKRLQEAFKESGFHHGEMTVKEFSEIVAKSLPPEGQSFLRELVKPHLNKKMPRMEIRLSPVPRMHIYGEKRIYTIELMKDKENFARINGEVISWLELVTPKQFVPHVYKMVSTPALKTKEYSWIDLLVNKALASAFYASSTAGLPSANNNTAAPENSATPPAGATLVGPANPNASASPQAGTTDSQGPKIEGSGDSGWGSQLASLFNNQGVMTLAVALGSWFMADKSNDAKTDDEEPVVVEPDTPPKDEALEAAKRQLASVDANKYFKLPSLASVIPTTSSGGLISGVEMAGKSTDPTLIQTRDSAGACSGCGDVFGQAKGVQ